MIEIGGGCAGSLKSRGSNRRLQGLVSYGDASPWRGILTSLHFECLKIRNIYNHPYVICVERPLLLLFAPGQPPSTSNLSPQTLTLLVLDHRSPPNLSLHFFPSPLPHWHTSPFPSDLQPLSLTHSPHHGSMDSVGNDNVALDGFCFCLCRSCLCIDC